MDERTKEGLHILIFFLGCIMFLIGVFTIVDYFDNDSEGYKSETVDKAGCFKTEPRFDCEGEDLDWGNNIKFTRYKCAHLLGYCPGHGVPMIDKMYTYDLDDNKTREYIIEKLNVIDSNATIIWR